MLSTQTLLGTFSGIDFKIDMSSKKN